jgi:hypothetical protein
MILKSGGACAERRAVMILKSGGACAERRAVVGVFLDLEKARQLFKRISGNGCAEYELVSVPTDRLFDRSDEKHHGYQR